MPAIALTMLERWDHDELQSLGYAGISELLRFRAPASVQSVAGPER